MNSIPKLRGRQAAQTTQRASSEPPPRHRRFSDGAAPIARALGERGDWVTLNVGGRLFETTRQTLASHGGMLADLVYPPWPRPVAAGPIRLDRDPDAFGELLQYLRNDKLNKGLSATLLGALLTEARYFDLPRLGDEIKHIYPWQEKKRALKGKLSFWVAYADYANRVFLHRSPKEGEAKWRKLHHKMQDTIEEQSLADACVLIFRQRSKDARGCCPKAIELMHAVMCTHLNIWRVDQTLERERQIKRLIDELEDLYPNLYYWNETLAQVFDRQGRSKADKVIVYATRAHELRPDEPQPCRLLARAYGIKGDCEGEIIMARRALQLAGDNGNDGYALGMALSRTGRDADEARRVLERALALGGLGRAEQCGILPELYQLAFRQQDFAAAVQFAQSELEEFDAASVRARLAHALERAGASHERVETAWREAADSDWDESQDPISGAPVLHAWADFFVRRQRWEEAKAVLRTRLGTPGQNLMEHRLKLMQILIDSGQLDEAVRSFEREKRQLKPFGSAWLDLAWACLHSRYHDAAKRLLDRRLAQEPKDGQATFLLGCAMAQLGDMAAANAHMGRAIALGYGGEANHWVLSWDAEQRLIALLDQYFSDTRD